MSSAGSHIPPALRCALEAGKAPVSVGLEPAPGHLPLVDPSSPPTLADLERGLTLLIDATADRAAAFKFNAAFFESLGAEGAALLERTRARLPDDAFVILDAKRGDIGSTARHYAKAAFETLGADAVTVNPLMGADAVEPFLAYEGKVAYLLCLTSNAGAADFLGRPTEAGAPLYRLIAERGAAWSDAAPGTAGFVVGATRSADALKQLAQPLAGRPLLIPGIGAQGGDARDILSLFGPPAGSGSLFHTTRGVLPSANDTGESAAIIRRKLDEFIAAIDHAASTDSTAAFPSDQPLPSTEAS